MTIRTGVTQSAADPKGGMTFGELREFVQAAMRADVADEAVVRQTATWRSTIRRLEVETHKELLSE
ncbi:hypothetical protein FHS43_006200 [Streptosporangium becharense]|uniref:Uncharacterized protein n=1 Tax=Streptosporangium becharense TaxID=1816182 RepID=A0A7W9MH87_9ACTN|nr:hypothetical protein [Streptosporangium becharense]MBB2914888.1 hypothetical protein [Streptosporangium becharense]MBB5820301.1 hypothetical protein [Streptosporangium becharense]